MIYRKSIEKHESVNLADAVWEKRMFIAKLCIMQHSRNQQYTIRPRLHNANCRRFLQKYTSDITLFGYAKFIHQIVKHGLQSEYERKQLWLGDAAGCDQTLLEELHSSKALEWDLHIIHGSHLNWSYFKV
jgi:hypothetical protein